MEKGIRLRDLIPKPVLNKARPEDSMQLFQNAGDRGTNVWGSCPRLQKAKGEAKLFLRVTVWLETCQSESTRQRHCATLGAKLDRK